MRVFPISPKDCISTHGAAGFMIGSYYDPQTREMVCGACGTRVKQWTSGAARWVAGSPDGGEKHDVG